VLAGEAATSEDSERELAAATMEARTVLRYGAAWGFFEHDAHRKLLFEFCEADLERLLAQLDELEAPAPPSALITSLGRERERERKQRAMALAAALRSQANTLRSYRRVGGA
jgi:hypothetical protein